MADPESVSSRILVLALRGRDAQVIEELLRQDARESAVCACADSMAHELSKGAGAAIVTEESLADTDRRTLTAWLKAQPAWSDFPFIVLATKRAGRRPKAALDMLTGLGKVVVLERPINVETLSMAVDSALRGRRRQYEAREYLEGLKAAESRLTQLNETLEARISQRTDELTRANNRLMEEIVQREQAQVALIQSQKMDSIGQLTGGIAHDFNNLLTVIGGSLELIQRRAEDERITRLADAAQQASDRAAKLTRQLLAFSRTDRLTLKPVDIDALIAGMNDLLARTIGPQFTVRLHPGGGVWAMADANQVELAILNLAINARDAMPEGGELHIGVLPRAADQDDLEPGDYAVISVRDSGAGIPPALIDKVFDPFFTTKPLGKGTGLGLSQVYGMARQSGGSARIHSPPGEGATVEIWLRATQADHSIKDDGPTPSGPPRGAGARIMVVDDDDAVRGLMVECLVGWGYSITEAASGQEALDKLPITNPDLLIVDFAMPGLNGAEIITRARAITPDLPAILATGYADMDLVDAVVERDHVLRKPFQLDLLDHAVRTALDKTDPRRAPPRAPLALARGTEGASRPTP
jgi:signal transduction histidine kinase/ActR/RegA family two-component response regulator